MLALVLHSEHLTVAVSTHLLSLTDEELLYMYLAYIQLQIYQPDLPTV